MVETWNVFQRNKSLKRREGKRGGGREGMRTTYLEGEGEDEREEEKEDLLFFRFRRWR